MRKHRFVTDDDIEESVQHDLAILREHFAEIGGWEDGGMLRSCASACQ